ncbi:MAG: hypothetical protein H6799_00370 [Candidatus Nomurabacteria bacterium]|nr:MAG: hypothetical protein H6799_00370 [Candidatus Nomurabacteria bacterium]
MSCHPLRRSTDQKVILHARAEDHPPDKVELEQRVAAPRVHDRLSPHGSVRLPSGAIVPATCLSEFIGDQFVRAGAELDPENVKFSD